MSLKARLSCQLSEHILSAEDPAQSTRHAGQVHQSCFQDAHVNVFCSSVRYTYFFFMEMFYGKTMEADTANIFERDLDSMWGSKEPAVDLSLGIGDWGLKIFSMEMGDQES